MKHQACNKCGMEFPKKKDIVYDYIMVIGKCFNCKIELWDKDDKPINRRFVYNTKND